MCNSHASWFSLFRTGPTTAICLHIKFNNYSDTANGYSTHTCFGDSRKPDVQDWLTNTAIGMYEGMQTVVMADTVVLIA